MTSIWRVAWCFAAAVLLVALSMRASFAQHPVAGANGSLHVAVSSGGKTGLPVPRHDIAPVPPFVGHVAGRGSAPEPIGTSGFGLRGAQTAPVRVPGAQPPILSRSTISGASFARPGMALLPIGGPAKPGATGINGSSIRPKH